MNSVLDGRPVLSHCGFEFCPSLYIFLVLLEAGGCPLRVYALISDRHYDICVRIHFFLFWSTFAVARQKNDPSDQENSSEEFPFLENLPPEGCRSFGWWCGQPSWWVRVWSERKSGTKSGLRPGWCSCSLYCYGSSCMDAVIISEMTTNTMETHIKPLAVCSSAGGISNHTPCTAF